MSENRADAHLSLPTTQSVSPQQESELAGAATDNSGNSNGLEPNVSSVDAADTSVGSDSILHVSGATTNANDVDENASSSQSPGPVAANIGVNDDDDDDDDDHDAVAVAVAADDDDVNPTAAADDATVAASAAAAAAAITTDADDDADMSEFQQSSRIDATVEALKTIGFPEDEAVLAAQACDGAMDASLNQLLYTLALFGEVILNGRISSSHSSGGTIAVEGFSTRIPFRDKSLRGTAYVGDGVKFRYRIHPRTRMLEAYNIALVHRVTTPQVESSPTHDADSKQQSSTNSPTSTSNDPLSAAQKSNRRKARPEAETFQGVVTYISGRKGGLHCNEFDSDFEFEFSMVDSDMPKLKRGDHVGFEAIVMSAEELPVITRVQPLGDDGSSYYSRAYRPSAGQHRLQQSTLSGVLVKVDDGSGVLVSSSVDKPIFFSFEELNHIEPSQMYVGDHFVFGLHPLQKGTPVALTVTPRILHGTVVSVNRSRRHAFIESPFFEEKVFFRFSDVKSGRKPKENDIATFIHIRDHGERVSLHDAKWPVPSKLRFAKKRDFMVSADFIAASQASLREMTAGDVSMNIRDLADPEAAAAAAAAATAPPVLSPSGHRRRKHKTSNADNKSVSTPQTASGDDGNDASSGTRTSRTGSMSSNSSMRYDGDEKSPNVSHLRPERQPISVLSPRHSGSNFKFPDCSQTKDVDKVPSSSSSSHGSSHHRSDVLCEAHAKANNVSGRHPRRNEWGYVYVRNGKIEEETRIAEFKALQKTSMLDVRIAQHVDKNMCAFLNSELGGVLYLGVHDDGTVLGLYISREMRDTIRLKVDHVISQFQPIPPDEAYQMEFIPVVGKPNSREISNLYVIEVQVNPGWDYSPCFTNSQGLPWRRYDASVRLMQVGEIVARAKRHQQERDAANQESQAELVRNVTNAVLSQLSVRGQFLTPSGSPTLSNRSTPNGSASVSPHQRHRRDMSAVSEAHTPVSTARHSPDTAPSSHLNVPGQEQHRAQIVNPMTSPRMTFVDVEPHDKMQVRSPVPGTFFDSSGSDVDADADWQGADPTADAPVSVPAFPHTFTAAPAPYGMMHAGYSQVSGVRQPPIRFCDPMSLQLMRDPVVAADGHTYERYNIEEWFAKQHELHRAYTSPYTGDPIRHIDLIPNRDLKTDIDEYLISQVPPTGGRLWYMTPSAHHPLRDAWASYHQSDIDEMPPLTPQNSSQTEQSRQHNVAADQNNAFIMPMPAVMPAHIGYPYQSPLWRPSMAPNDLNAAGVLSPGDDIGALSSRVAARANHAELLSVSQSLPTSPMLAPEYLSSQPIRRLPRPVNQRTTTHSAQPWTRYGAPHLGSGEARSMPASVYASAPHFPAQHDAFEFDDIPSLQLPASAAAATGRSSGMPAVRNMVHPLADDSERKTIATQDHTDDQHNSVFVIETSPSPSQLPHSPDSPNSEASSAHMVRLFELGFPDRATNLRILRETNHNLETAVQRLCQEKFEKENSP
jgi:U-box domain/Schlafen, AlbA_2